MPDISMCINFDCPMKLECYRYTAEPNEYYQSWCSFRPVMNIETNKMECEYFHPITTNEGTGV